MKQSRTLVAIVGAVLLAVVAAMPVSAAMAENKVVNINTASVTELTELKGIGNAKAQAIVTYREKSGPFKSVDDLQQVDGIGEKLLAKLRPQVTVGSGVDAPAAAAKK